MAFDYFVKIDGIAGDSTNAEHAGEIDVLSFSFGVTNSGGAASGAGGGVGRATFQELMVTSRASSASPQLFLASATGQRLESALLTARDSGEAQPAVLRFTLSDILVSSYLTTAIAGSEERPIDQFSLNFGKIKIEFQVQQADGSAGATTAAGWDMQKNVRF